MKGFKGFKKGLICDPTVHNPFQYAENTIFEQEAEAEICGSGFHFCENPFDVLEYYGYVSNNGELNEFAEVEALDECKTDDNKKYTTKKLRVGTKLTIPCFVKAFIDFTFSKIDFENYAATNTGNRSAATNTGKNGFAIATGYRSKARGALGCFIALAEWAQDENGEYYVKHFKTHKVDGKTIKPNIFYTLENGNFVKAEE